MFPIHIHIGSVFLPFYEGAYFAASIMIGAFIGSMIRKKEGLDPDEYWNIILWGIFGAVIGGRLFHVLFWGGGYYFRNPLKIFTLWEGGISIIGGIAGALAASYIECRWVKASFIRYLALLSPVILFSQGLGRLGCFMNGDAFGLPSGLPWAVQFKRYGYDLFSAQVSKAFSSPSWVWCFNNGLVSSRSALTVPMHPTQLYEAFFDFILAGALFIMIRKKAGDKTVTFLYLAGYSLFRFLIEYIRGDRETVILWNTSLIQFVLAGTALLFLLLLIREILIGRKASA